MDSHHPQRVFSHAESDVTKLKLAGCGTRTYGNTRVRECRTTMTGHDNGRKLTTVIHQTAPVGAKNSISEGGRRSYAGDCTRGRRPLVKAQRPREPCRMRLHRNASASARSLSGIRQSSASTWRSARQHTKEYVRHPWPKRSCGQHVSTLVLFPANARRFPMQLAADCRANAEARHAVYAPVMLLDSYNCHHQVHTQMVWSPNFVG